MNNMSLIEIKNLYYKYDKDTKSPYALKDINLCIDRGDFIAIIGNTGSGKSTLIKHINALIKPTEGEVLFDGVNIYSKDYNLKELRKKIGMVFQYPDYQLFAETVLEDVAFAATNYGYDKNKSEEMATNILRFMEIEDLKDRSPFMLSGGEKRKVAFSGSVVLDPEVIILDEPEAGLDPSSRVKFFNHLKTLNEKGKTIIFVTHNLDDVVEYADKVVVLHEGELIKVTDVRSAFYDEELIEKANINTPDIINVINEYKEIYDDFDITKIRFNEFIEELKKYKSIK